jgi:predicted CXXCH cytochrome family protein
MNARATRLSIFAGAALALAAGGAWAQTGIAVTKHNLSNANLGTQANSFSGTDEICVFCHTPHGADVTANPPLWNRTLPASGSFQTYDTLGTTTLDGEVLAVGSVSIACLSCHDGAQAMNVVINAPGSGLGGDANWTGGIWTGPALNGAPVGSLGYNSVVNLGTDLTNDHPIGVEYAGGACRGVTGDCQPSTGTVGDVDFEDAVRTATGVDQWYVDVDGDGTREKTDMILYTRPFSVGGAGPSVECASCHDPHTDANGTFLRTSNNQSGVCLACHIK